MDGSSGKGRVIVLMASCRGFLKASTGRGRRSCTGRKEKTRRPEPSGSDRAIEPDAPRGASCLVSSGTRRSLRGGGVLPTSIGILRGIRRLRPILQSRHPFPAAARAAGAAYW